ncbi:hypothetical protein [Pseudonocardia sp. TRM90224]|uniref:hypothetical protein n=1 Tax=Pseudonocardia sp. TRM90224 TaxID=2812678 RepID=UPI001E5B5A96|nr:hypothetical protein [Pseudonocardia sp. TRM90224]
MNSSKIARTVLVLTAAAGLVLTSGAGCDTDRDPVDGRSNIEQPGPDREPDFDDGEGGAGDEVGGGS